MSSRKSELRPAPRPSAKIGLISDGRSITPKISAMPLSGDKLHALGVPRDFDHHRQLCPLIETGHPVLISRRLSAVDRNRKALITGGHQLDRPAHAPRGNRHNRRARRDGSFRAEGATHKWTYHAHVDGCQCSLPCHRPTHPRPPDPARQASGLIAAKDPADHGCGDLVSSQPLEFFRILFSSGPIPLRSGTLEANVLAKRIEQRRARVDR